MHKKSLFYPNLFLKYIETDIVVLHISLCKKLIFSFFLINKKILLICTTGVKICIKTTLFLFYSDIRALWY